MSTMMISSDDADRCWQQAHTYNIYLLVCQRSRQVSCLIIIMNNETINNTSVGGRSRHVVIIVYARAYQYYEH